MGETGNQHRDEEHSKGNANDNDDADSAVVPHRRFRKRRRNSDPSSNRPLVSRHRGGPVESDRSSSASGDEGAEEIEVLPDRFDSHGRPVDGSGPRQRGGWTERRGDFAYRSPRPGGAQIRGTWGVAGTDPEHVERMVRDMSGMLAGEMPRGMGGWLGLAGRLLGGVMAPGAIGQAEEGATEEEEGRHRDGDYARGGRGDRRDVIGYGGGSEVSRDERGKGRRRIDDHEYNDEEDDEERHEMRRRRRRRRREVD